jgi:hypothetical protein
MDFTRTSQTASEKITTDTIEVGHGVEVCRKTVLRREGSKRTTKTIEYVKPSNPPKQINLDDGHLSLVKPELLKHLQMTGWFSNDEYYKLIVQEKPFTHIQDGKPFEIVRIKSYDHSLYAMDGTRLPVAMYFDYTNGGVSDRCFDLRKLCAHLLSKKDVTLIEEPYRDSFFHTIPSYNSESGNLHLTFIWHPDAVTFRKFVKANGNHLRRYETAHKILGNDQFRIAERGE